MGESCRTAEITPTGIDARTEKKIQITATSAVTGMRFQIASRTGPLVPQRVAQIPARQPDDVVDVLLLQRAVEPQAGLDRLAIQFSRAAGARFLEQDVDDAARNQPDHHDDDQHEQQHGGDDGQESPDGVTWS